MSLRDFARRLLFTTLQCGFRLAPMRAATRDRWRRRFLERYHTLIPDGPRGQVTEIPATERRARGRAAGRAIGYQPFRAHELPGTLPATLVAFYLPQFHTIPENDAWWGEGFTEWHNVARALPQFEGHAQPRLPGELGFYDLRLPEIMRKQMLLARNYGVGAFCSYFYWFAGKILLEAPLKQWLADASLDLPMCLCWANENWSRRWDGRADDILMKQSHSADDDIAFIDYISSYLVDPRYLRVDGKPLLLIYRPSLLPDAKATARRWRERFRAMGLGELHLAYVQSFDRSDPRTIGFDAAVEFPPNNTNLASITANQRLLNPTYSGDVWDWRQLARASIDQAEPAYPRYPGVNPAWNNEPRRSGKGRVFAHASPRGYRDWLRHAVATARRRFPAKPLVFVNAWNEWAEGAILEPDARLGHAWLEATRSALQSEQRPDERPCAVIHIWHPELLDELLTALADSGIVWRVIITTAMERESMVRAHLTRHAVVAELEIFENRGRDILPFLHVANRLLDEGVTTVVKLHGKRSTHRKDGDIWRRELLDELLAPERASCIAAAFRDDATLGLVHAEGHLQPLNTYWGANQDNVNYLARRLGVPCPEGSKDYFVAGSMFWLRPAALRPLLDANLEISDFDAETGQIDGTLAHAVERTFTLSATTAGFRIAGTAEILGLKANATGPYPYASRIS